VEAPRVRRADAHPDAPARRPLLARDLGEPLELDQVAAEPAAPPVEEVEHRPLPSFLVPQAPEPEEADLAADALYTTAEEPVESEIEPEARPEGEWEAPEAEADPSIGDLAAQLPEAGEETDQPLAQLVNRIEFGLARKRQALPAADLPPAEEAAEEPEKVGHRLRSAINDLQKIASSGA
jgi:hypothetical protein